MNQFAHRGRNLWVCALVSCVQQAVHQSGLPWGLRLQESVYNAGHPASIPGFGRSPEKGMATHSSILPGEPLDSGVWRATVPRDTES